MEPPYLIRRHVLGEYNNTRKACPESINDKDELHRSVNVPATFACLGSLIFWSLGPIFVKYLTGYLDSWTQNLLRYLVACLFWLPFLFFSLKTKRLDHKVWRRALVPAAANVLMQSLYAAAFYYIGPAFMVLQMKTNIIWIAGFSFIFFSDERALVRSKHFWIGLILSIVGVVGVMYNKVDLAEGRIITGIVVTQAAAFMWGVYTISVKVAFKDIDSRSGFSVTSIYTVAGLAVFALLFGKPQAFLHIGAWQWVYVVISGITAIAFAHTLYYAAIRRIGATIPALVILAQPFIVLAISHVIFRESMNIFQLFFGVILLTGSALAIWAQQHLKHNNRPQTRSDSLS
jgi:drug/metabolite transporter (DMT)-like permease